jgi:hypothetical protein
VDVAYATGTGGTATSGVDYEATSGSLRFTPGQTSKTVKVFIAGDTLDEPRETFYLNLSGPVNATLGDTQAMGTIVDNDPTPPGSPDVSISDASVTEGDTADVQAVFTVSLSAASAELISVTYATGAAGTATAGVDYTPRAHNVFFQPGQTAKTFGITVLPDTLDEANETFFVNLTSAGNATLNDAQGKGTIVDEDAP